MLHSPHFYEIKKKDGTFRRLNIRSIIKKIKLIKEQSVGNSLYTLI